MNPRHRRLVIPVALAGLLLIVVVAALFTSDDRTPPASASPGCAATCSTRRAGARGGVRPAEGHAAAVDAGRAAVRRPQGRPPPPGHGVRRHPGAHRQPRRRRRGRDRRRRRCSTSRSATGTSRPRPRPTRCGSPRSSRRSCTPATGPTQVEVDRGHDRDKERLLARGRPGAGGARDLRRAGPDQAQPAGEVPPGRGVPAAARRLAHRRDRQGPRCAGRPPRSRCGSSTSAAATPTSPSPRTGS